MPGQRNEPKKPAPCGEHDTRLQLNTKTRRYSCAMPRETGGFSYCVHLGDGFAGFWVGWIFSMFPNFRLPVGFFSVGAGLPRFARGFSAVAEISRQLSIVHCPLSIFHRLMKILLPLFNNHKLINLNHRVNIGDFFVINADAALLNISLRVAPGRA